MKVRDEELWQQQCQELQAEEIGREFLEFVECWVNHAEDLLSQDIDDPAAALRAALEYADGVHGRVSVHFIGQMLVVIGTHWFYGEEMMTGLTPIELRLVQDMLALKFAELKRQAASSE